MKMTKRTLILIMLATTLILGGCVSAPELVPMPQSAKDLLVFPHPPDEPRFIYERTLMSSTDVTPDSQDDALMRSLTGAKAQGEGLGKPYGVVVNRGRVYVGDTARRNISVFDIPENKFFTFGEEDPGQLGKPLGLDIDKNGNVYVLDGSNKVIFVYDRDGKYLRTLGNPGEINRPAGLGVSPDGSRVYAVDIGGSTNETHRILVYDGISGEKISEIGKRGTKAGEFNLPRDVAVAADGSLFVVDGGNFRVQHLSADGKFIGEFGSIGRLPGQFSRPKEVALDKDGNVYVTDAAFGNFQIFNAKGELLLPVGTRSDIVGPTHNMLPSGIAVDSDGRIYFVDQFFKKVDVYRPIALGITEGYTNKDMKGKYDPNAANAADTAKGTTEVNPAKNKK
jgi:DNA-binding beta-propeller fold protein YncE